MSRNRILAALVALVALALSATVLSAPADARAAKLAPKPKVGQCRTTTFAQSFVFTDNHKPVPCSQAHRMKTFAVVSLPKKYNPKTASDATWSKAGMACLKPFWRALGSSFATRDQSAYVWSYFGPSKADRKKGARWIRCDLSILVTPPGKNSAFVPLPNRAFPMIGSRALTDDIRKCLSDSTHLYVTTCSRTHAARADQTFVINSKSYPSIATMKAAAESTCPGKRFSSPYKYEWLLGDHTMVCYSITTS